MLDPDILGEGIATIVRDAVAAATAPLATRIAQLEARPGAVVTDELLAGIEASAARAAEGAAAAVIKALPQPTVELAADPLTDEQIAAAVRSYLEANPPLAGRDGVDGKDGIDGKDGAPGRDADPVSDEALARVVAEHLTAHPPASGRDGLDGKDGAPGMDGKDGADGRDGVGLAGAVIDRQGALVVTLTDGSHRELGQVVGRDGADGAKGEPGRDGFNLTDLQAEFDEDGRFLNLALESEDLRVTHRLETGNLIFRGVWREGEYRRGDTVQFGGAIWHANKVTSEKPGEAAADWTLAVRRGRDGKDGAPGPKGDKGDPGRNGRDLTQLGADGAKW